MSAFGQINRTGFGIIFYLFICRAFYLYVRRAGRSICTTCGPQYMSGFGISILSIHLRSRQINWTGFAIILFYVYVRRAGCSIGQDLDYFIYLPAEHFICMYNVHAAVYVRHVGRTICTPCRLQYMSGFGIILSIHLQSRQIN